MKKLCFNLAPLLVGLAFLVGCTPKQVQVPDPEWASIDPPLVEGSLSDFVTIDPESYTIEMSDTLAVLTLRLRTTQVTCSVDDKSGIGIFSNDSDRMDAPCIVMLDDDGGIVNAIDLTMTPQSQEALQGYIQKHMDDTISVTFVSRDKLTDDQRKIAAKRVANMRLEGRVQVIKSPEDLKKIVDNYLHQ